MTGITETVTPHPNTDTERDAVKRLLTGRDSEPDLLAALGLGAPQTAPTDVQGRVDAGLLVGVSKAAGILGVQYRPLKNARGDLPLHTLIGPDGRRLWDITICEGWWSRNPDGEERAPALSPGEGPATPSDSLV